MQAALTRLKIIDLRERLRLALAKRRSERRARVGHPLPRTPCSVRGGEASPEVLQQHAYVILPLGISVDWSIPGLIGLVDADGEHVPRAFRINTTPISVMVDNRQMDFFYSLVSDFTVWLKSDRQLQLRPERRIRDVLHRGAEHEDWQAVRTRRAVVPVVAARLRPRVRRFSLADSLFLLFARGASACKPALGIYPTGCTSPIPCEEVQLHFQTDGALRKLVLGLPEFTIGARAYRRLSATASIEDAAF